MKIHISKEWCIKMALKEGDEPIGAGALARDPEQSPWERLLLTVARVLRAKIKDEIYAEQACDLEALNEALAPFDAADPVALNEVRTSTDGTCGC